MAKQFLCKLMGHDYDISIVEEVGGSLRVVAEQCTRCGHTTRSLRPEAIIQAIRPANDKYGRIHTDGSRSGGQPVIKTEAMEHVIHSSMPIDFERRYAMDNLIAQDADLIGINNKDSAVLLPCPFCGGVQIEAFHHIDRGWGASWHVECVAEECGNSTCHHDTEAAAIAAWNTRQPTHRNVVVAAAPADRIGGGGGLQCGVVGVATQSDALLEGDAQTILYLLGVRHGREDERAKIAAEASQPTQSDALRDALADLLHAVCGKTGFAEAVRRDSGRIYPWPALDLAEAKAIAALEKSK